MPVLRYRDNQGELIEVMLDLFERRDGKKLPLTVGLAPESENHIHLPDKELRPQHASILGSVASSACVVSGKGLRVNGRSIECLRVLRHGDDIQLGNSKLLYLDFNVYRLRAGSEFIGLSCSLAGCGEKFSSPGSPSGVFSASALQSELVSCPWCKLIYHARCWFRLEQCATGSCYPIRRMLLTELSAQITLAKMTETPNPLNRKCGAGDAELIEPGKEIIRCHNSDCGAPYHLECWLSMRAPCFTCGADIPGFIENLVFRTGQRS